MERALRIVATSLLLLGTVAAAAGQGPAADPDMSGAEALCEAASLGTAVLDDVQRAGCRELWQKRVAAARQRSQDFMKRAYEERGNARTPATRERAPVTVESFLHGDLAYGDVVVTDKGPRVFVGRGEEPPKPQDFVALDSPRSPHRGHAAPYEGAYPGGRPVPAKPRRAAPAQQERQP